MTTGALVVIPYVSEASPCDGMPDAIPVVADHQASIICSPRSNVMKWKTHTIAGLLLALTCQVDAAATSGILTGAVFPDAAEMLVTLGDGSLRRRLHRGTTHWFGWYLPFLVFQTACPSAWTQALFGFGLGAIAAHICLDALNPSGVPLMPFRCRTRLKIPIVRTGTLQEFAFTVLMVIVAVLISPIREDLVARLGRLAALSG